MGVSISYIPTQTSICHKAWNRTPIPRGRSWQTLLNLDDSLSQWLIWNHNLQKRPRLEWMNIKFKVSLTIPKSNTLNRVQHMDRYTTHRCFMWNAEMLRLMWWISETGWCSWEWILTVVWLTDGCCNMTCRGYTVFQFTILIHFKVYLPKRSAFKLIQDARLTNYDIFKNYLLAINLYSNW